MKTATITPKSPAAALCAAAGLAIALSLAPRPAAAWYDDAGWGYSGYDDWSAERMQDTAIASQEEATREVGREKRRAEIEAKQAQASAEHEEYFAAVMDASKASLSAPRGVYYRKPGFTSGDAPPPASPQVAAGPVFVIYDQGVFWLQKGSDYVVVIPPAGVVVDALPQGIRAIPTKEGTLFYYFGVFYKPKGGKYEVVKPAAGTVVGYLPDGYTKDTVKDQTLFTFGETRYKQIFLQGVLAYQVV